MRLSWKQWGGWLHYWLKCEIIKIKINYYIIILYSSIDDLVIFEKLDGGVLEKNIFYFNKIHRSEG